MPGIQLLVASRGTVRTTDKSGHSMRLTKKKDTLFSKRIIDLWGILTVILAFAAFLTGKTDIKSFFQDITLLNFLETLVKTIAAYGVTLAVITFSFFIVVDLILLVFGLKFPIAYFLWTYVFGTVVMTWWWDSSLAENIFLSIVTLYFISSYDIETEKRIFSFFYKKVGEKYNGFSVGLLLNDMRRETEGVYIGLLIVRHKNLGQNEIGEIKETIDIDGVQPTEISE